MLALGGAARRLPAVTCVVASFLPFCLLIWGEEKGASIIFVAASSWPPSFSFAGAGGGGRSPLSTRSKPTTEFAQPRLSRVKQRSSPTRGYKFGCVCSYMAGHEDAGVVTGHIGTNLYPLAGDDRRLTLLKRGCANSVVGLSSLSGGMT